MNPTPFNDAEAIIEPFWDPQLSGLKQWTIRPGKKHGLSVSQNWCWVNFEWARRPARGSALTMTRRFNIACSSYDQAVISVMPPEQSVLTIILDTDRGTRTFRSKPAGTRKQEHTIPLHGAQIIRRITLSLDAGRDGVACGWINWIGLQHRAALRRHEALWDRFDARWDRYLEPPAFKPSFTPAYGLLINQTELTAIRRRHDRHLARYKTSPWLEIARRAGTVEPETRIRDFVNFWSDTRYCRERDHGNELLIRGPQIAFAGLLLKDPGLLRLGARYAMSLGMCANWDDGMICRFPGSTFEHRSFVQSLCVEEISLILDMACEYFTPLGRDHLMRRIAEEGLAAIQFNAWKHEYIFNCNQMAWFTPGRMLGSCLLERHWPRVRHHTEQARRDLVESLQKTILPDGGYDEGPTYFTCVGHRGGLPLYVYARARKRPFRSVLPPAMRRTASFAELVASTDEAQDVIPICDGRMTLDQNTLSVMASALPHSAWVRIYRRALKRTRDLPDTPLALQLDAHIPRRPPPPVPLVRMRVMGPVASTRRLGDTWVKLFIMGNHANAGHTHEDKGSFVLEFAGQTFAMDPGTCDYSSPLAGELKHCERHNMLVPYGTEQRPHPSCPLPHDIVPRAHGDARRFSAIVELANGWEPFYQRWTRHWDSPTPDTLIIRDTYRIRQGTGVEFFWNTRLPISVENGRVTIQGTRGRVRITPPPQAEIRVDELPLLDGIQRRLVFRIPAPAGVLLTHIQLDTRGN